MFKWKKIERKIFINDIKIDFEKIIVENGQMRIYSKNISKKIGCRCPLCPVHTLLDNKENIK